MLLADRNYSTTKTRSNLADGRKTNNSKWIRHRIAEWDLIGQRRTPMPSALSSN